MTKTNEIYPKGTILRITEDSPDPDFSGKSTVFTVDDYVSANDSEDGTAFYVGNGNGGYNNIYADARYLEVVATKEAAANRKPPTAEEIINHLSSLDRYEGFFLDSAEAPEGNRRLIEGTTDDGIRFGFYLVVEDVQETDY